MLMIDPGTKNGEMRRGPLAIIVVSSSIIGSPPMPEPTLTPTRSAFESSIVNAASSSASSGAASPVVDERVGAARLLRVHPVDGVEALHLRGDAREQAEASKRVGRRRSRP